MQVVDKLLVQKYAEKNTSSKMPIEAKFVAAFIDSLLNSNWVQKKYQILAEEMWNENSYIFYNSLSGKAKNLNKEPYRSIVAYSMLKKDLRLFELISASMFTGSVVEYHGRELYTEVSFATDEFPTKYTDSGIFTDMERGFVQIGFKNYYCNDPLPDGTGTEWQTFEELEKSVEDFRSIITLTKPARVGVLLFYVPWCYLSGNETEVLTCGIDQSDPRFTAPFGDSVSMNILDNMSDDEVMQLYREVRMFDYGDIATTERAIESERSVLVEEGSITFDYNLRIQSYMSEGQEVIWGHITIFSNAGDKVYSITYNYDSEEEYFERYDPIMLRLEDNNPDAPCLALEIENDTPTVGAMFYTRTKAKGE